MTDRKLTPEQTRIARQSCTEAPFSGPWLDEKRSGTYCCIACGQALFTGADKYDSGSGWPSFRAPVSEQALGTTSDTRLGMARTEVHCAKCQAHMGHVFPDGPEPTGLRYCINGSVLDFEPEL